MARRENVFLRKDGRYEARYAKGRDRYGKLIYGFCYGKTYEEAKEKADCARNAMEGHNLSVPARGVVFAYYCDSWLSANMARLKTSSLIKYKRDMENHIIPYFGNRLPGEITSEEVMFFTRMLLEEKKLSIKTVRNILSVVHLVFAYIQGRTDQRFSIPKIIYPKMRKRTVRVLDEREEKKLILFLIDEMDLCKLGVYMALRTGMRIGEVCALKWRDISFKARTISVGHTAQRVLRQGSSECLKTVVAVGSPKTASSYRTIPLMPDMASLCSRFYPDNPETFVLTGTVQCMDPRMLQRRLKMYTKACRIDEVHFHTLRHTFATRCVEVGFDVKTLSEILGHSNINITMNQYVHPNIDFKRENMKRLKNGRYI